MDYLKGPIIFGIILAPNPDQGAVLLHPGQNDPTVFVVRDGNWGATHTVAPGIVD